MRFSLSSWLVERGVSATKWREISPNDFLHLMISGLIQRLGEGIQKSLILKSDNEFAILGSS